MIVWRGLEKSSGSAPNKLITWRSSVQIWPPQPYPRTPGSQ